MLCSINDYLLADGTISGGFALTGLRLKMERIFETVTLVPKVLTGKNGDGTDQTLIVGMVYKILVYVAGDDFTTSGGTNVTGNVFVATGSPPPGDWDNHSNLVALSPAMLDRNKRKCDISFTVQRVHASIKDAENYCNVHDETIPRTGDIKLIVSEYFGSSVSLAALLINGVLLSHELIRYIGSFTEHQYQIVGSPIFAPTTADHLVTEGGDRITTEGGDELIVE